VVIVGGAGVAAVVIYGLLMVMLKVQELQVVKQLLGGAVIGHKQ
jgi:hypothetical protein